MSSKLNAKRPLRIGLGNWPESGKRGLLKPASKRPPRIMRIANRRQWTSMGGVEVGNNLEREARRRKWWRPLYAKPNSTEWGNKQCNAVFAKKKQVSVLDDKSIPAVGLNSSAVLLERHSDDFRYTHIAAHVPTEKRGSRMRAELNDSLAQFIRELGNAPWVLTADTNSGAGWLDQFKPMGGRLVTRGDVMVIACSRHFKVKSTAKFKRKRLSDHHVLSAALLPQARGRILDRLP